MEIQNVQSRIYEIRGQKVMLDFDLAELYGTETKRLKEAVRRNPDRFPADFMFELTKVEFSNLRTQIASSSSAWGGRRYRPYAFTEQGVAMLSSVLTSKKAVLANIAIMRAFVFLRQYALTNKDLSRKLRALEKKYDRQFKDVYEAINFLLTKNQEETAQKQRRRIGFRNDEK